MKFRILFSAALLFILHFAKAQENKLTQNVLTATILEPGISYEASLGSKFTAKFRAGINAYLQTSTDLSNNTQIKLTPYPFIGAGARYYYGFTERTRKGKNTLRNSANYIGLSMLYGIAREKSDLNSGATITSTTQIYNAGVVWGLQRNYKNRFSLDFNIGPNLANLLVFGSPGITSEFTIGIWLGKKTEDGDK